MLTFRIDAKSVSIVLRLAVSFMTYWVTPPIDARREHLLEVSIGKCCWSPGFDCSRARWFRGRFRLGTGLQHAQEERSHGKCRADFGGCSNEATAPYTSPAGGKSISRGMSCALMG